MTKVPTSSSVAPKGSPRSFTTRVSFGWSGNLELQQYGVGSGRNLSLFSAPGATQSEFHKSSVCKGPRGFEKRNTNSTTPPAAAPAARRSHGGRGRGVRDVGHVVLAGQQGPQLYLARRLQGCFGCLRALSGLLRAFEGVFRKIGHLLPQETLRRAKALDGAGTADTGGDGLPSTGPRAISPGYMLEVGAQHCGVHFHHKLSRRAGVLRAA